MIDPARKATAGFLAVAACAASLAQIPPSASEPWVSEEASSYPRPPAPSGPSLPGHPLSLGDLINLTLQDNPDTRGSWQVAVQAASNVLRAKGAFLPDISVSTSFGKQYQKTNGQLTSGPILVPQVQIVNSPSIIVTPSANLTWMLWDFGASKANLDAAKAGLVASNFQHNRTLQGVVRQVQAAYFGYDTARGALDAADAAEESASASMNEVLIKRRAGLAGVSDEMQARQAESQAALQREQARQSCAQARAQLLELAGIPPDEKVDIAEQPAGAEPAPAIDAVDALVAKALATRPDIAARYAKVEALEADLRHTQRSFLPTVALSASVSRMKGEQGTVTSQGVNNPSAVQQAQVSRYDTAGYIETAQAGIGVSMDLTNFVTYHRAVEEKRAEVDAARAELRSALITAEHDVWMSVDACRSARKQFEQARELLDISEKAFTGMQKARANGLESTIDLLQSQQALAQARYALVNARALLFTSAADLAYATGDSPMGSPPGGG